MPPIDMFEGLDEEMLAAIRDFKVTPEMVRDLVEVLKGGPRHAEEVCRLLSSAPWATSPRRKPWRVESQLRFLRNIRTVANFTGHPVISDNSGYRLGTWEEIAVSARRSERLGMGHYRRAGLLRECAERYGAKQP